jgi:acyl-CoA synthetase (AMP-forming)/AMP-acid ligase II
VFLPTFTPGAAATAIADHEVTDALLVPTMIQMLVDSPETATADLSSMRRLMYGASPISEAVLARARQRMQGVRFTQAYGMTELSPVATLLGSRDHDHPVRSRSAGRAVAGADVRIVAPDDKEVSRGEVGEVVVRGDNVMVGYWNKPQETAQALRHGWMHTGDAGYMDEDGYMFVVDRIKDMIITGGENVYSVEVENALALHPAVATCAVVGIPDELWGERVHAVVVRAAQCDTDADELRRFCREHIAGYKVPRTVAFVDALPMSAAGKVLKRELRQQSWPAEAFAGDAKVVDGR